MSVQNTVVCRLKQLCKEKNFSINGLANYSGIPQSTLKSIINGESKNTGIVTIKMICDGLNITLGEFFSTKEFDELAQEIK